MSRLLALGAVLSMTGLAGCARPLECGEGTVTEGDTCVAVIARTCGEGTRLLEGRCVPLAGGLTCGFGTLLDEESNSCAVNTGILPLTAGRATTVTAMPQPVGPATFAAEVGEAFGSGDSVFVLSAYYSGTRMVIAGGAAEDRSISGLFQLINGGRFALEATPDPAGAESAVGVIKIPIGGAEVPLVLTDAQLRQVVVEVGLPRLVNQAVVVGTINFAQANEVVTPTLGALGDYLRGNGYDGTDTDDDGMDDAWPFEATLTFTPAVVL